jgi:hypothetical protein
MEPCGCGAPGLKKAINGLIGVILVLFLVIMVYHYLLRQERMKVAAPRSAYVGRGLDDIGAYTSGADLRVLGQQFSSTNQGSSDQMHIMDLRDITA